MIHKLSFSKLVSVKDVFFPAKMVTVFSKADNKFKVHCILPESGMGFFSKASNKFKVHGSD